MKIRDGFVPNSSSSSFVVAKSAITAEQRDKIYDHYKIADDDAWSISENNHFVSGYTFMDNFNMFEFLIEIGIPSDAIRMEYN